MTHLEELSVLLLRINHADELGDYNTRNPLIFEALLVAIGGGIRAGIRIDPKEPEWPVAYIELPSGQITYHLPQHDREWDGHTTEEKKLRILRFASEVAS